MVTKPASAKTSAARGNMAPVRTARNPLGGRLLDPEVDVQRRWHRAVVDEHQMPDRLVARPAPQLDVVAARSPAAPTAKRCDGTGGTHRS